tara:strand:+ start:33579 stop:33776 length:198 start_codon:yes stop_codon:yes gene_type:complete
MSISDLDKVVGLELNKCVYDVIEILCDESKPFDGWWMNLDEKDAELFHKKLFNVLNRRINKHKFG